MQRHVKVHTEHLVNKLVDHEGRRDVDLAIGIQLEDEECDHHDGPNQRDDHPRRAADHQVLCKQRERTMTNRLYVKRRRGLGRSTAGWQAAGARTSGTCLK